MNNFITEFLNAENFVSWKFQGQLVGRTYTDRIFTLRSPDDSGVVIVELGAERSDNAIIVSSDGKHENRISNPFADKGAICFGDVYMVKNEITLICCFASKQLACVINSSGKIIRTYETR